MIFVALYKLESSATTDLFEKWIFFQKIYKPSCEKDIVLHILMLLMFTM